MAKARAEMESLQLIKKELLFLFFLLFIFLSNSGVTLVSAQTDLSTPVISQLETVQTNQSAEYSQQFAEIISTSEMSLAFISLDDNQPLAFVEADKQLPVASAFKGPVAMYFFNQVPTEVWQGIPIDLWASTTIDELPEEYHSIWQTHGEILHDVYTMVVKSDNTATGNVLNYVAQFSAEEDQDPIDAFNYWGESVVGTSSESGLFSWTEGATNNEDFRDERFSNRFTEIYGRTTFVPNTMSARDLVTYYLWMNSTMPDEQKVASQQLLSIVPPLGSGTWIETLPLRLDPENGISYSKSGIVSDQGWLVDAGIISTPDDGSYAIVVMSVESGDKFSEIYQDIQSIIENR